MRRKRARSAGTLILCASFLFLSFFLFWEGGEGGGSACQFASGGEEVVEDAGQCADGRKLSRSDLETGVCLEPGGRVFPDDVTGQPSHRCSDVTGRARGNALRVGKWVSCVLGGRLLNDPS